ncbi:proteasome accessory factor PafA2 family protein [Candidatus Laterigemmans baculatus]|uniref:proteasome accessory factor PafA2 family protein n=1 Tax=Candidatus Laterigemmans baculatus TaxID=2770505 RepID=UPI0013DBFAE6|nr:proteasome accessory factor PafA2 family protein [Candidatus Laterigemmans baculatus]
MRAKPAPILERLIGLETEYATLLQLPPDQQVPPSRQAVYAAVCEQIAARIPIARGRYDSDTIFLANGGAFSIESSPNRLDRPGGLIEGATAESCSPARVVEAQRAQDRMIAEAAAASAIPGELRIVKNSCDAYGHIYGCQENYAAPVATGLRLALYWMLLVMMMPAAVLYWFACIMILGSELAVLFAIRSLGRLLGFAATNQGSAGDSVAGDAADANQLPLSLLRVTAVILRVISLPAAGMLYLIARFVAFREQRKFLTAFLVSRVVLTGAGHVDRRNRFRLSSKALAIDTVTGFGGYLGERPIYVFHHWLQQLCGRSLLSIRSLGEMFRQRQRLQIGLSDSNISDTAEYLKVGATALVLDLIEAGGGRDLPRLQRPIQALHRITCDWNLVSRVLTNRGELSALDIQRAYLQACMRFVEAAGDAAPREAHRILERWEATLAALAAFRSSEIDPLPALGHVDWLTKKWMLDRLDCEGVEQAAAAERWMARKKIDIRYHELSDDSYFARLRAVAPQLSSVDPAGIDLALRMPPLNSPALRRGQLIREFSGGTEPVAVDWSHLVIGSGRTRRIVAFD